jgi:hypothetical protein
MSFHLERRILNTQAISLADSESLTVHYHPHILDKMVDDLKSLRCSYPSLVLSETIQPLEHRLDVLLSKKLLNKFLCVALSQVIHYLTEDGLTRFSLFNLCGSQREGREKLHEYLDNHLSHSNCRRDLGINIEATQKVFDRLKQIDQGIVAVEYALDRLIRWTSQRCSLKNERRHIQRVGWRGLCVLLSLVGSAIE